MWKGHNIFLYTYLFLFCANDLLQAIGNGRRRHSLAGLEPRRRRPRTHPGTLVEIRRTQCVGPLLFGIYVHNFHIFGIDRQRFGHMDILYVSMNGSILRVNGRIPLYVFIFHSFFCRFEHFFFFLKIVRYILFFIVFVNFKNQLTWHSFIRLQIVLYFQSR